MSADTTPPPPAGPRGTQAFYATIPTREKLFWRTFLPWQLWRFVWINLKMLRIIARSHHGVGVAARHDAPRKPSR